MSWIIISANGEEIDRRELSGPIVIGRSPECDIAVRDLLLSRTHCRLEPVGNGWKVVDLNSRNGTRVGWQGVQTHALRDGDHLRMGRTRIVFHAGPFEPAPDRVVRINRIIRPADPHEALTGTVTDFVLVDDEELAGEEASYGDRPYPQPRPLDPTGPEEASASFQTEPASSFWCTDDSAKDASSLVLARPRTALRALPKFPGKPIHREIKRRAEADTDLSLQADARLMDIETAGASKRGSRRKWINVAGLALAATVGTGIVVMSIWLLTLAP